MIVKICHIYIARSIHSYSNRTIERSSTTRTIGTARRNTSRQRAHNTSRSDFTNFIVKLICHIYIAKAIHRYASRIIEGSRTTRTIDTTKRTTSRQCAHHTGRCNFTNFIVNLICHIYIARSIHSYAGRLCKRSCTTRTISNASGTTSRQCYYLIVFNISRTGNSYSRRRTNGYRYWRSDYR